MPTDKTSARLARLMADILQRDVPRDLPFTVEARVTPLDIARLTIAIEQSFGITIPDEAAAQWRALPDATATVQAILESGEAGKALREEGEREGWFYS